MMFIKISEWASSTLLGADDHMTPFADAEDGPLRRAGHDHQVIDLTVVVPTLNEVENVAALVAALHDALDGEARWEVVFVDDNSADGTAEAVKTIARSDQRVRCIHRIGRKGLSSAVVEGALSSAAEYIAVIDADLQHDETRLPMMLAAARLDDVDVVVGSRYADGADPADWNLDHARRTKTASKIAAVATGATLTDPTSGFFLIRRDVFTQLAPNLSAVGFKLLLDIFASSKSDLRFRELPYALRERRFGTSKLENRAAWDFLMLLIQKAVGRDVPARFISFIFIGGSGVLVHLAVFYVMFSLVGLGFVASKAWAAGLATVSNFALNNFITYHDRRLKGWRWVKGLVTFSAVCSIGLAADIGISSYLYNSDLLGGLFMKASIVPVLAGVVIGSVWNYAVSSVYTWRNKL